MSEREAAYMGRAKGLMAGGFALLAFVAALAVGTSSAPALGGFSWLMVTAGSAGVVYVVGAAITSVLVGAHLRPAHVTTDRGGRLRSSGR